MIRIVPLAQAKAGMVLGQPADAAGQVLLAEGTTLTDAHLALFATRGLRSLAIAVPDEQRAPIDTKLVLSVDRTLRPRFVRCDLQHPALKEIYRLSLMRRIQLTAQASGAGAAHAG
jgi:hypothetical protein